MMEILSILKERLRITWDDEDPDLKDLIDRSKSYLEQLTGVTFNFEEEKWPKELLLERCRYIRNNVGDEFENNYKAELKRLILLVALGKVGEISETAPGDV